ncbi:hypothetical protein G6F50_018598 [Rhizopus delemar]|uniref:Uncharacterized protein n=1 Tax=Rhizopus delemar TaxID=936053 RepID=A0A9P6XLM1_9FUNG|nr:hypothetical protein G6F50_018598 [Rhizopus delemar]
MRGVPAQCTAAVRDVLPDDGRGGVAGEHAIATPQQVIKRVQACFQLPVLAGHEHTVDFRVQAGDVVDGCAVDVQDQGMPQL